jgi:ATP-dependent DNA helicase RecG
VNAWRQASIDFVRPPTRVVVEELEVDFESRLWPLVLMGVQASEVVVATTADDVYLRVGDEDRKLGFDQRRELLFDKGQAQYEATPVPEVSADDLDADEVAAYGRRLGSRDPWRALEARSLVDTGGRVRVAGVVGFARHPDRWLPQHLVRVIRYDGRHRLEGARQNIRSDQRFAGPLGALIPQVREAILREMPTRRALTAGGRFENVGLIPEGVWLEAVVNALIHRSYSNAGDHIRVEIFDDALSVESPGRFPGVVDLTDPRKISRFARNPRIARLAADLRFGQELGEGMRRMFEEMSLAGLVQPEFHQTSGSVQVVLSGRQIDPQLEARLPPRARELLQVVREREHPSTGDVMAAMGLSRPAAIKALQALSDEGLVERVGRSTTDPRAYWRVRSDHRGAVGID